MGLAEKPNVHYPTQFQILDALQTAKEMGATVVRSHTLGISVGNSLSIARTLSDITGNTPQSAAFATIDYAIYRAGLLGIRLIIPLTDDHNYYHGGLHTFAAWRSVSDASFYTNSTVIGDFKTYIGFLLNHVNSYTGIAYKNDPTILCWETGNELAATGAPPSSWTSAIATHIKTTLGAGQLVMDGTNLSTWTNAALTLSNVDMYTSHYYPQNVSQMQSDAATISGANKVFIVGEYDWTNNVGGTATMTLDTSTYPTGGGTQSLKVVVAQAASQDYFDQLQQAPFTLTSGHTYTFSFWAKSTGSVYTSTNPLGVQLQQNYGSYNTYKAATFVTTTSWAQYSFTYTYPSGNSTDTNVLLCFNMGLVATTTNLDLVSLTDNAAPGTNLISDPSFANATISPWINNNTVVDTLAGFLSAMESATASSALVSGSAFWDIYPHDDSYGFVLDSDIYTLYYPGNTADMQTRSAQLRNHAYAMQGVTVPASSTPIAPTITAMTSVGGVNTLKWSGVVGGMNYALERAATGTSTFTSISTTLTDFSTPYADTAAATSYYRVRACEPRRHAWSV